MKTKGILIIAVGCLVTFYELIMLGFGERIYFIGIILVFFGFYLIDRSEKSKYKRMKEGQLGVRNKEDNNEELK